LPPADEVLIGLDVGTTGIKALAVTDDATVVATGRTDSPEDPANVGAAGCEALAQAVAGADRPVAGVALSGAMHSLVGLGADGGALTPLLTWADHRADAQARRLRKSDPHLHRRTGTPVHPMSPLCKLIWWREEEPETFAAVRRWVGVKELVVHALTGELLMDHGTASGTGLRNLQTGDWDEEALALAGLEPDRLAPLVPSTRVTRLTAARTGLPAGTPVVIGGADGPLANLGLGAIRPGTVACSIGTSGAVRAAVDAPALDERGQLFCYVLGPDRWVVGGATSNGGSVLDWLGNAVAPDLAGPEEILRAAAAAPAGSGALLFVPHLEGERAPQWTTGARGAYLGLRGDHGRAELLRAALEGVCLQLARVLGSLGDAGVEIAEVRATGGFARSALWRGILASAFGRPIGFAASAEGSGLGAALLGLTALGMLGSLDAAADLVAVTHVEDPDPDAAATYAAALPAFAAAQDAIAPIVQSLGSAS
jgi:gluconokinase